MLTNIKEGTLSASPYDQVRPSTTKVIFNYLTNKFGILLFVMTILPFSHQLFAQSDVASVFLNPYYSQRILAWENNSGNQVSTWQIDISYGTESNGVIT